LCIVPRTVMKLDSVAKDEARLHGGVDLHSAAHHVKK
jgi:hypothetical protein